MQAHDACVGAGSRDASRRTTRPGLKHPGNGLDWARLRDGSEPEADRVMTISLGMVLSECTFQSHGGAMATHLQGCKSMVWDSPGLGLQWGHGHARFCVQRGTKSTAVGSISFFFVNSKDFAM